MNPGDRIALMTPIFTPYLNIPTLNDYDLDVTYIQANTIDADGPVSYTHLDVYKRQIYVWVIFPLVCEGFSRLSPKAANVAFALIIVGFAACVTASYLELKLWEKY